jgi:soluble lytic murein transglycosylase
VLNKSKYSRLVVSLAGSLLLWSSAVAQTPQARHQQLRAAIDSGDTHAALVQLQTLRSSNPQVFQANNYDYLVARLLERSGDITGAAASYQATISRGSILSEYSLWHLAQLSRAAGDLVQERERLRQLINISPNGLLRNSASMRLGQSSFESQDFDGAVSALRPVTESKNRAIAREASTLIGESLLRAGRTSEARDIFTKLLMQMPDASRPDDFALAAVRALDNLDAAGSSTPGNLIGQLTEAEHLLRGSVYQFNRDFDAARLHFTAVVDRFPQSPTVANAIYQIGRGFYLQQKYPEALAQFQRVLNQFPESTSARDALSFSAGAYNRMRRTDEAVSAYKLFSEKFPDAPNPERPFLNIIDSLHEAGRYQEALQWVQQTRVRFRTRIGDALALFAQLRIHLAQGAWQAVVADANELSRISDLGGTRVPGGTSAAELTFLRAFALEQLGRTEEAITEYLSLPDGRNDYYGKRATRRLLALATSGKGSSINRLAAGLRSEAEKLIAAGNMDQGRRAAQNALRLATDAAQRDEILELVLRTYGSLPTYKLPTFKVVPLGRQEVVGPPAENSTASESVQDPHSAIANELLFLGLYDEGAPEFVAAKPVVAAQAPTDLDYTLAVYQLRGGHADQAVRFAEQVWKGVPGDYVLELATRDMVDLLYPLPFRESLLKHATARDVDPRFVISIARQESRFQPDAKSVAAARGLMQFIAETSTSTSAELGLRDFRQDDLYNSDTAILFGSQYLASLFKQFPGQPQAVVASYNGGPDNMARWLARSRSNDPDRYVSEIGFSQTKDYVFKVMTNFWQYQQLYDEKLERK